VLYFNNNYVCGRRPLATNNTLSTQPQNAPEFSLHKAFHQRKCTALIIRLGFRL